MNKILVLGLALLLFTGFFLFNTNSSGFANPRLSQPARAATRERVAQPKQSKVNSQIVEETTMTSPAQEWVETYSEAKTSEPNVNTQNYIYLVTNGEQGIERD